jgi:hypothetical protein
MSQVSIKIISLVGCTATFIAFAMAGCAGTKTDDVTAAGGTTAAGGAGNGEGGTGANLGGATSNGTATSNGGSASTGGTTSAHTPPPGVTCSGNTAAPGNPELTSFGADLTPAGDGVYTNTTTFKWGDSKKTLTGGTFFYDNDGDDKVGVLTATIAEQKATITGTIPANEYAGFGFWFGPCTDATNYTGISFTLAGDMGGDTEIQVQVQSSLNYPIDDKNSKGECTGTWAEGCASNAFTLKDVVLTAEPQEFKLPWTSFIGGKPVDPLNAGELLGFQWQFNCGPAECKPSVIIDDVKFYK